MRRRVQYFFSMATLVALSGCGDTATEPIEPTAALDEVAAQAVAADVVEETDAKLPHLPSLVHEAFEIVRSDDAQVEAATAFRRARRARIAAREAHEAGNEEEALRLLRRARRFTLEGVIAALGPGVATEAIAGVEAAIAHWDERVSDRDVPERFLRALEHARTQVAAARNADSPVAALSHALIAAAIIRALSPAHLARRALRHAAHAFRAATGAVGDAPTDDERATLAEARRLLARAEEAFQHHEWRAARRAALASAELSLGVLDGRSP